MITTASAPKLVVSDIDGTFLDATDQVSERLLAVVWRMIRSGTPLVLATGRPPRWLSPVVNQLGFFPQCVCSNGAAILDSAEGRIDHHQLLSVEAMAYIAEVCRRYAPLGGFAAERTGDHIEAAEPVPFVAAPDYEHSWLPDAFTTIPTDTLLSMPVIKLLLREATVTSEVLYNLIAPHIPTELAEVTYSVPDGLLEFSAPGVSKATGIDIIARRRRIDPRDILVAGDMPNDLEMMRYAGHAVAMGNAAEVVKVTATEVTGHHNEDGLAAVLERWF